MEHSVISEMSPRKGQLAEKQFWVFATEPRAKLLDFPTTADVLILKRNGSVPAEAV